MPACQRAKNNDNIENVNKLNPMNHGNSIITQAIYQGAPALGKIKVLVDHGADINLGALKTGDTAIYMCSEENCVDEIIKIDTKSFCLELCWKDAAYPTGQ